MDIRLFFFFNSKKEFCFTSLPYSCYVHHSIFSLLYRDDGKESAYHAGSLDSDTWAEKILWGKIWQSTPLFLPGEFQGERSLAGDSLTGLQRVRYNRETNTLTFFIAIFMLISNLYFALYTRN